MTRQQTSALAAPIPGEGMLAADRDRDRVAEVLRNAHAAGRLTLAEFDERAAQAYAARTYADLSALTADLPEARIRSDVNPGRRHPRRRHPGVTAWVWVNALCLLIWAISCLAAGQVLYPWWLWVAGPWGLMVLRARHGHRTAHRRSRRRTYVSQLA